MSATFSERFDSLKDDMQEELVVKAGRQLWKDKSRGMVKSTEWSESDGLLIFCGKIYVVRGSPGTLIPDILAVRPKASQSTDSMICGP
jgi:hypothetical protein